MHKNFIIIGGMSCDMLIVIYFVFTGICHDLNLGEDLCWRIVWLRVFIIIVGMSCDLSFDISVVITGISMPRPLGEDLHWQIVWLRVF